MMFEGVKQEYRGSGPIFFCNVMLYLLAAAPLMSFCLMGDHWLRLFVTMSVLSVPLVLLGALLVHRYDGFTFDDAGQQFIKGIGRAIPYASVKRIDLNVTGRLLHVGLKQGGLRSAALSSALDSRDKPRLMAELGRRFPGVVLREKRQVDWKSIAIIAAIVVVLTGGFQVYVYRNDPGLQAVPQLAVWKAPKKNPKNQQYVLGQFEITMQKRFQLTGRDDTALQFEDRNAKTEVRFIIAPADGMRGLNAVLLRYASGIDGYYDVLKTAYHAKWGVVPLVLKMLALSGFSEVALYEVVQTSSNEGSQVELKGFITQGRKNGQEVVSIVLQDEKKGADIHAFLSAPLRLKEKTVREIAASVRLRPGT
jgi:hypothetical protein